MNKYLRIFCMLSVVSVMFAPQFGHTQDSYKYVIDGTGIQFYGNVSKNEFDVEKMNSDKYYICTEENREIVDVGGGRGVVMKSCHSYRNPIEKIWVKTYAVDAANWKFCDVESFDNRLVVMNCPRVHKKK